MATFLLAAVFLFTALASGSSSREDAELKQLQQEYVDRGRGMFLHFNMTTFDREANGGWGNPALAPETFAPTELDPDQWAQIAKDSGMTYAILTVKHHLGFSLWDTPLSEHDLASSPWARQNPGKDFLEQFVRAFRSRGLEVGFYYSIWDRRNGVNRFGEFERFDGKTHWYPPLNSKDATEYVRQELALLIETYEPSSLWFDGWEWNYKVGLDYVKPENVLPFVWEKSGRKIIVLNNEPNFIRNYRPLEYLEISNVIGFEQGEGTKVFLPEGNDYPAEVYATIRADGKWFYVDRNEDGLKSVGELADQIRFANDNNATFLLDFTPDRRGLIPDNQARQSRLLGAALQKGNLARGKNATQSSTAPGKAANHAVDGAMNTNRHIHQELARRIGEPSYSQTARDDPAPWWMVDLGQEQSLSQIVILRHLDEVSPARLMVEALDDSQQTIFKSVVDISGGQDTPEVFIIKMDEQQIKARHLRVSKEGPNLRLAEVLAF